MSPQAVFTCAPHSLRHRAQKRLSPQRLTYCSIASPSPQILCFCETESTDSNATRAIETFSVKLGKGGSAIVNLGTFQSVTGEDNGSTNIKVLATHEDGTVSCYTHDLVSREWTSQISRTPGSDSPFRVEYATIVSIETARKAILKNREDILPPSSLSGDESTSSLLLTVIRDGKKDGDVGSGTISLKIFSIRSSSKITTSPLLDNAQTMRMLASTAIEERSRMLMRNSTIAVHSASGTMYLNVDGVLAIYEITGFMPRLANKVELDQGPASSHLRVSTNLIAYSNAAGFSIVALPYCSIQEECSLAGIEDARTSAEKQKSDNQPQLLSYYAPSNLLIGLYGRKLLAIPLSSETPIHGTSKKRKRAGVLVDSLGRAPSTASRQQPNPTVSNHKIESLGTYMTPLFRVNLWETHKAELDRCALHGDTEGFEAKAFSLLGLKAEDYEQLTLQSKDHQRINEHPMHLILSTIFSLDEPQISSPNGAMASPVILKIRFLPRRICNLLIERALITPGSIEKSLKWSRALSNTSTLTPGCEVQAFADWDSSLELLSTLIASNTPLGVRELIHALAIASHESNAASSVDPPLLVTNGEVESTGNEMQMQFTDKTEHEFFSPPSPFSGATHSHRIFTVALQKLFPIPSYSIARALKTELSTKQTRILVDALRMEIARSGWLSSYESNLEISEAYPQDNHQICHVAHLLNCAIDSVGTGGWLLGTSMADDFSEPADTIAYMKAEISAAIEAIEEATYLKGMLGDLLLCGKDTLNTQVQSSRPIRDSKLVASSSAGSIQIATEEVPSALPLGLRLPQTTSITKVAAGGELKKRSKRDIGRLKSRAVGKYSFERIVI